MNLWLSLLLLCLSVFALVGSTINLRSSARHIANAERHMAEARDARLQADKSRREHLDAMLAGERLRQSLPGAANLEAKQERMRAQMANFALSVHDYSEEQLIEMGYFHA